ncbi:MAG: ATP-dependent helicase C-terminal domain-containing protein, partial [Wenzhouxiangellaceae bacterium]
AARVEYVRGGLADWREAWPPFDDDALNAELDQWLAPFLAGMSHWRDVEALDLLPALKTRLGHSRLAELDRLAPEALDVPAGVQVPLDYRADPGPVLAVKLQAVFGWTENPHVLDGRLPVVLHLLSPAGRPLAITADLTSFWANAYPDVLRDMRGRYPKHPWPDDPVRAAPTLKTRLRTR